MLNTYRACRSIYVWQLAEYVECRTTILGSKDRAPDWQLILFRNYVTNDLYSQLVAHTCTLNLVLVGLLLPRMTRVTERHDSTKTVNNKIEGRKERTNKQINKQTDKHH